MSRTVCGRDIVCALVASALAFSLAGCGGGALGAGSIRASEEREDTYPVALTVECRENLMFSRYDVNVYVDGEVIEVLDHGQTETYDLNLSKGTHKVRFAEKGDDEVDGSAKIVVSESESSPYLTIHCTASQVEVEVEKKAKPPLSQDEADGMPKEEVEKVFEEAGFSNISLEEKRDLALDQRKSSNTVASVTIDGRSSYSKDDEFLTDDKVIIAYHLPADIAMPFSSVSAEGEDYESIVKKLKSAGFENVKSSSKHGSYTVKGLVEEVQVGGGFLPDTHFDEGDKYPYDAEVEVIYSLEPEPEPEEDPKEEESSSTSSFSSFDSEYEAKRTFERYGEILYPYGFKCHWILDLVALEKQGDGSYYIKVGVTIENAYGNTVDTYAQGVVDGNNVRDFWVS